MILQQGIGQNRRRNIKFYGKFAIENNYTITDLKKLLNRDEYKSFKKV